MTKQQFIITFILLIGMRDLVQGVFSVAYKNLVRRY